MSDPTADFYARLGRDQLNHSELLNLGRDPLDSDLTPTVSLAVELDDEARAGMNFGYDINHADTPRRTDK